jgi:hypothetical protein
VAQLKTIGITVSSAQSYFASPDLVIRTDTKKNCVCPVDDCGRSYTTASELHKHIRAFGGRGHRQLKEAIDQNKCPYCPRAVVQKGQIRRHEQECHEQAEHEKSFKSRLDKLLPYLAIYPREYTNIFVEVFC